MVVGVGGIAVGVVAGLIVTRALFRTADPILEIVVSLIAPTASFLVAEELGVSGVLAVVVAGLITGRKAARVFSPDARLLGLGAWQIVIWTINTFVFMLIGLQLPSIIDGLSDVPTSDLLWYGFVVSLTVIVARFVWVFPATYVPRWLSQGASARTIPRRRPGPSSSSRGRACAASSRWRQPSPWRRTSRSAP